MQLRRILLFAGLALLMAALAASLVPVPEQSTTDTDGGSDLVDEPEPLGQRAGGARGGGPPEVRFPAGARPRYDAVPLDERVVVTVAADEPGQVELEGLGRLEPVVPGTPAVFDLFTDVPGRFPVVLTPVDGA